MTIAKLDPTGSNLSITWDTGTCTGAGGHQILYGDSSQLPGGPGGAFALAGGVCGIGSSPPFAWSTTPEAGDGSGLVWWLIVATNGTAKEGAWGDDGDGAERIGPGPGGSSGQCGILAKDLGNACGH